MNISPQQAELIAIKGLQYLAGDEEQLGRFLALSGCNPEDLRKNASEPAFMAGILEYYLGNEPTLLAFCAAHAIAPESIQAAQYQLEHANNTATAADLEEGEF